ncbi:hypothetical protein LINGRAHAP2_LOCUS16578 [Linum grandiflorum]
MYSERRIMLLIFWPMVTLWPLVATMFSYPTPFLADGFYLIVSKVRLHEL